MKAIALVAGVDQSGEITVSVIMEPGGTPTQFTLDGTAAVAAIRELSDALLKKPKKPA